MRLPMWVILTILGALITCGGVIYKYHEDKRSSTRRAEDEEKRHKELVTILAAANAKQAAYTSAVEDLKAKGQPVPPSTSGVDFSEVDSRLEKALKEVEPARAARLRKESDRVGREHFAVTLAKDLSAESRPVLERILELVKQTVARGQTTGLYRAVTVENEIPVPADVVSVFDPIGGLRTHPSRDPLATIRFDASTPHEWLLRLDQGTVSDWETQSPEVVSEKAKMPSISVVFFRKDLGETWLAEIRVKRGSPMDVTVKWIHADVSHTKLEGLRGESMVRVALAELMAESRIRAEQEPRR